MLFNLSLQHNKLAIDWKKAVVIPVYKKGSPSNVANYRPISLTPIICKFIECGIRDALLKHMMQNNFISPHQHGFMSKKSTTSQLLELTFDIASNLKKGYATDVIYLDYAKAFDTVSHCKLIANLKNYKFNNNIIMWVKNSYLNEYNKLKLTIRYHHGVKC